jgi:tetratricopeptide (TPR) repeat protein
MEKNGLFIDMQDGVADLAKGRRMLYIEGTEVEGLKSYKEGYEQIISLFKEAIATGDPEIMLLAELYYTARELYESQGNEPVAKTSAQAAVRKFDEALQIVKVVQNQGYSLVHKAFSTEKAFRHKGMPKDAFHIAFLSDRARVKNGLSRLGLSPEDRDIALGRVDLIDGAMDCYMELQRKSLDIVP